MSVVIAALVAMLVAVLGIALLPMSPAAAAAPLTARQPILFVHGYDSSADTWTAMVANFRANGYVDAELFPISYDSTQSNATTAAELAGIVSDIQARTGWPTIDVVTHSMGGLSSRYYLKNLGGTANINDWVGR